MPPLELPPRPNPPPPAKGNWLGLLLALGAGLIIFTALAFLTGGFLALVVVVAGGVFGLAALHYVVWGWWLSKLLYEEEAAENAQRQGAEPDGMPPHADPPAPHDLHE